MNREEVISLVRRLDAATRQKAIMWESTADNSTFLTTLAGYPVTIAEVYRLGTTQSTLVGGRDEDLLTFYVLTFYNAENRVVDLVRASYPAATKSEGFISQRLRALYFAARRGALKSEDVVTEISSALDQMLTNGQGSPTLATVNTEYYEEPPEEYSESIETAIDPNRDGI